MWTYSHRNTWMLIFIVALFMIAPNRKYTTCPWIIVVCSYKRIICSNEKEWATNIHMTTCTKKQEAEFLKAMIGFHLYGILEKATLIQSERKQISGFFMTRVWVRGFCKGQQQNRLEWCKCSVSHCACRYAGVCIHLSCSLNYKINKVGTFFKGNVSFFCSPHPSWFSDMDALSPQGCLVIFN